LPTPEVDVCRGEVVDALMVSPMVVMIHERLDLRFEVCREEVVFQQDAIFQGLMPALDLTLSLRMIRRTPDVPHFLVAQSLSQLARDVAGSIVRQQSRLVNNMGLPAARCLQGKVQRVGHIACLHGRAQLPGNDVARVIIKDCR
jgi:hypothetical protein